MYVLSITYILTGMGHKLGLNTDEISQSRRDRRGFEPKNYQGIFWRSLSLCERHPLFPSFRSQHFNKEALFREGLWGRRKTRLDKWPTFQEMTKSSEQASDHAAVYIDLII